MNGSSLLILRGVISIVAGILAFAWPGITIAVLVVLFGIYAIIDGVSNLVLGLTDTPSRGRSWVHAVQGVIGIGAGVLAFTWPAITSLALIWFIGAWAVVTGALEIAAAIRLRRVIAGEWMLALSGLLSCAFGLIVLAIPAAGAVAIAWTLGAYAVASGVVLTALGIKLRARVLAA